MSTIEVMPARLTREETDELRRAVRCLEGVSFSSRAANLAGRQVEALGRALPTAARDLIARVSESALRAALKAALRTLDSKTPAAGASPGRPRASERLHIAAAAASGAVGGAFGLAAAPIELPISTTILMRAIANIARQEGEDLGQPEAALACIEVFALGGPEGSGEKALEGGYFAVRAALARSVSESARFLAQKGAANEAAPILVRLISQIAARFGVVVTEKLAAQAVPILGAVGGAAINAAFADHFQTLARGHFIVRRLERAHGAELIRFEYQRLRHDDAPA